MATGTVSFYNGSKGFGFIHPDDHSTDVFVHTSALQRAGLSTLKEGQTVSYDLKKDQSGKETADNIKVI